jgi:hypothetical protein
MQDCVSPKLGYDLTMGNCSGGYVADVFTFAASNGSVTERLYPYTAKNETGCKASMVAGLLKQRPSELFVAQGPAPPTGACLRAGPACSRRCPSSPWLPTWPWMPPSR